MEFRQIHGSTTPWQLLFLFDEHWTSESKVSHSNKNKINIHLVELHAMS